MQKKSITITRALLSILLFLSINVFINNTVTSWKIDVTENKLFTLSQGSKNIVNKLKEPVSLRFYFSESLLSDSPQLKNYGVRVRELLEAYVDTEKGKVKLAILEPEQFSEVEDEALLDGMHPISIGHRSEIAYMGIVGTNTTDDEIKIALFHPEEEQRLEYELTNMIYKLGQPAERTVGIISSLPVFGKTKTKNETAPWRFIEMLRGEYEVRDLGAESSYIAPSIDTLLVIHPKSLKDSTLYAIDQFILRGGKAIVFVDPIADMDETMADLSNPMIPPIRHSNMPRLFKQWGIVFDETKIAGDAAAAMKVRNKKQESTREIAYIPWLHLLPDHFNQQNFSINQLKKINVGTAGFLSLTEDAESTLLPLISTSKDAMAYERDAVLFVRDPSMLVKQFVSGDERLVIAARVTGKVRTAFPNGKPGFDSDDPAFISKSNEKIKLVIVADTDILSDRFWVKFQTRRGARIATAHADNATFVLNVIEMLAGSEDMISLRSRGEYKRPFSRVDMLRSEAEKQFRQREQILLEKLTITEEKLQQLKSDYYGREGLLISAEQRVEIETLQIEKSKIRKDLRIVQYNLNKTIDKLGSQIKFINMGLIPIAIVFLMFLTLWLGRRRQKV